MILLHQLASWCRTAAGLALCLTLALAAQETPATATLHVYTNLLQIPVLVVDSDYRQVPRIPDSNFLVSLDSGKPFHPKHVRREGDDAISLAIVFDRSDDPTAMRTVAAEAITDAFSGSLTARDHVTIYTLNCRFYREFDDVPAVNLTDFKSREELNHDVRRCDRRVHLWDALAHVTRKLGEVPGRRVVLVISDGGDRGSKYTWNEVRELAVQRSVAIFGVNSTYLSVAPTVSVSARQQLQVGPEDAFRALCELTGGIVLHARKNPKEVSRSFTQFVELVRDRYILEFPRLDSMTAGAHDITVWIPGTRLVIRPAGDSAKVADRALLADPMTIPPPPDEREAGPRKELAPDR